MEIKETVEIFNRESGQKEKIFNNNYNKACLAIGLSVSEGSVRVKGRLSENDSLHDLSLVNFSTCEITNEASDGLFSVIGSEVLHSIVFIGENAKAYAKLIS